MNRNPPPDELDDEARARWTCLADLYFRGQGALATPAPALDDPEGDRVPDDLPTVIDAHVHLFPDRVFESLWEWFERFGWPVRYRLHSERVIAFLLDRGVSHLVALHYAHRPGMARALNAYVADLAARHPRITGLATVLPGEPGAADVLDAAFRSGLSGVKLHTHVQCFPVDGADMAAIYEVCVAWDRPLVIHAGREPRSAAYRCDTHALCDADRVDRVLRDWPGLRLCVPHLGADEFDAYARLLRRHDHLWLDTTMMVAGYFPMAPPTGLIATRPDRILYGTDFPNLPYAWDRELLRLRAAGLSDAHLERLLAGNARALFGIAD